jgi:hypothetical protein
MKSGCGLLFGVALAILLAPACFAGPCAQQVEDMQGKIDAKLNAAAAAGPAGKETKAATMNRQPTPKSIAEAEVKLGDIPAKTVQAIEDAMARARKADLAGDRIGCEQALADAQRALAD